jgi:DNA modification methylase
MAEDRLKDISDDSVHLTVTSPPYSNQRHYANGCDYDPNAIIQSLYQVTRSDGGLVCWNEGLTCRKCDEISDPYQRIFQFKAAGFKLLQTIIVKKDGLPFSSRYRFGNQFEYCWVFLKGNKPRTFNKSELRDRVNRQSGKNKNAAEGRSGKEDALRKSGRKIIIEPLGYRSNVWDVPVGFNKTSSQDKELVHDHPAVMSEFLADPLIRCYSQVGDVVLDPFSGSATTLKMAQVNGRDSIGIERSNRYISLSLRRLEKYTDDIEVS